jgi:hypothetical protein
MTLGRPLVSPGFAGCHSLRAFPGNRTGSPAPALGRYHDEAPLRFASSSGAYRRAFRFDFPNPIFCEPKSPKHRNFPVHNQPGGSAMSQTKGDDRFEGLLCVKCGRRCGFPAPNSNRASQALCTVSTNAPNAGAHKVSSPLSKRNGLSGGKLRPSS